MNEGWRSAAERRRLRYSSTINGGDVIWGSGTAETPSSSSPPPFPAAPGSPSVNFVVLLIVTVLLGSERMPTETPPAPPPPAPPSPPLPPAPPPQALLAPFP